MRHRGHDKGGDIKSSFLSVPSMLAVTMALQGGIPEHFAQLSGFHQRLSISKFSLSASMKPSIAWLSQFLSLQMGKEGNRCDDPSRFHLKRRSYSNMHLGQDKSFTVAPVRHVQQSANVYQQIILSALSQLAHTLWYQWAFCSTKVSTKWAWRFSP